MAQTLEQRKRNAKYVKAEDAKRGKAEAEISKLTKKVEKSPVSPWVVALLVFVLIGGLIFELISRFF